MAHEIINSLRSKSVIRVTGNTATRINLSQLSANTQNETVTSASISQAFSSTDGFWKIYRGDDATGTLVLDLYQTNALPLSQYDLVVANTPTANIYVTNSGSGGSLVLMINKTATYLTDVDTGKLI